MGKVQLYAVEMSPPCRSVMLVAHAIGLEYEFKLVDLSNKDQLKPEFLKLNPQHTVPTIVDNGYSLYERGAIIMYLMNKYAPDSTLYPQDPASRGLIDSKLFFDSSLFACTRAVISPVIRRRAIKESREAMPRLLEELKLLNTFLEGEKYVCGGSEMTVADLSLLATVSTVEAIGLDLSSAPNVTVWLSRMKQQAKDYEIANGKGARIIGAWYKDTLAEVEA